MYFNGTKCASLVLSCIISLSVGAKDVKTINETQGLRKPLCFIENKGQIVDQYNNHRNDIQYNLQTPGMTLFIGNGQLHYQFKKVTGGPATKAVTTTYRTDVTLIGADPLAMVVATGAQEYYENYFLSSTDDRAITAHSFDKITYQNVYPNIDWVLYVKDNQVEYDFVVRPGGNVADIKLKYGGATSLKIAADGSLVAETPMGKIKEKTPYAFENGTGKTVASAFKIHNNVVTFQTGAYTGSLTIDPLLLWSTYCGGTNQDVATGIAESPGQNTYISGYTASPTLATFGVVKNALTVGGGFDAFLAKYNNAGVLQFFTYYGGTANDQGTCVALDNTGTNVYLAGFTTSATGVASVGPGVYHAAYNGGTDGFIVKLNNTGTVRIWATYFGGTGLDVINGIANDAGNNIYITGQTASNTLVSSAGAYQTARSGTNDAFIAKFNSAGVNQWSTYYGGTAQDQGFGIACDVWSNVIVTGQTNSVINIASPGAFHTTMSGTTDAFLVKFRTGGTRVWGTYFGGTATEQGNAVAINPVDSSIAIVGNTTSAAGLATLNGMQTVYGGIQDGYVAYFTPAGTNLWSSYYGGSNIDYGQSVCFDALQNIVIAGGTFSSNGISDANAIQPAIGGDYDAFVAKIRTNGQRLWATYFGGTFYDYANGVVCDVNNQIVLAGYTTSIGTYGAGGITTVGAQQTVYGGGTYDAFVTKFRRDTMTFIHSPYTDTLVCLGGTLDVYRDSTSAFQPGNVYNVYLSNAAGSFVAPSLIGTGTTNPISCTIPGFIPAGTGYRIRVVSSAPAFTSPDNFVNIHIVPSIPATTASSNSPVCVGGTIRLYDVATYTVDNYSWTGPLGFSSGSQNPTLGPAVLGNAGIYSVTTTHNGCPSSTSTVPVVINNVIPPTPSDSASGGCAGSTIYLFANPDTTATGITYHWTGPAGFVSTLQNPTIPGATVANSGFYFVSDTLNGCPSAQNFVSVTITPLTFASLSISATPGYTPGTGGGDTICHGTMVHFTAFPTNGGSSPGYQWMTGPTSPVIGAISSTWESASLTNLETVYCVLTSSAECPSPVQAPSNVITMNVIENAPLVYISASPGIYVTPGTPVTLSSAVYNAGTGALYQWYLNGVAITGATNKTFTIPSVTMADTVRLEVTSTMNCAIPAFGTSNTVVVQTNVGVANVTASLENIGLFPNPNSGNFTVKGLLTENNGPVTFDITNLVGQVVYTEQATFNSTELNKTISLKNIPDGVYVLRITQDGQSKIFRFSVQQH